MIAGPETAPIETAEPRETVAGVVGVWIGLGLLALFAAVCFFTFRGGGARDGGAYLAGWFLPTELPFGLAVREGALLPGGVEVVVLACPGVEDEDAPAAADVAEPREAEPEEHKETAGAPSAQPAKPKFDWSTLEAKEAGTPPSRAIVMRYPRAAAESVYERQFRQLHWVDPRDVGDEGGRAVLASDRLEWGDLRSSFVHERLYEKKGEARGFRDSIRVNLAAEGRFCVAYFLWPRGYPASIERVREVVDRLRPTPAARTAGG
jgi:hypothetical protein